MSVLYMLFSNNQFLNELAVRRSNTYLVFVPEYLLPANMALSVYLKRFALLANKGLTFPFSLLHLLQRYTGALAVTTSTKIVQGHNILVWSQRRFSPQFVQQFYENNSNCFIFEEGPPVGSVPNIRMKYEGSKRPWFVQLKTPYSTCSSDKSCSRPRLLICIKPCVAPPSVTTFVSGQNVVRCPRHSALLCTDFNASSYFCSAAKKCSNKSKCNARGILRN